MLDFTSGGARPREPMFSIPGSVVALLVVLLAIHAVLSFLPVLTANLVYIDWGFTPGRLTIALWPQRFAALQSAANESPNALAIAKFWRQHSDLRPWTVVTYAFLHANWTHVGLNCVWIVAFGPPLARRFGPIRFFLFFAATAMCGAALHWLANIMDFAPLIGASASASGFMAGAARFMFQPGAPLGPRGMARGPQRAASLAEVLSDRRALIFIGVWLVTNVFFGAGARLLGASDAPVAWIAHIGGFVGGLALFPLFDGSRRNL